MRVAELEKEMSALRDLLKQKDASSSSTTVSCRAGTGEGADVDLAQVESLVDAIFEEQGDTHGSVQIPSEDHGTMSQLNNSAAECAWALDSERVAPRSERKDVIERGLLSIGTARQLVELYMTEMYPVYPIVYLDPACTAVGYFYR